jgi:hypothetical protein
MEDRVKQYMSEYLLDREQRMQAEFSQSIISMCLWAFLCGAVIALSSLLPMIIGFALGITAAYNKPELVSFLVLRFVSIISQYRNISPPQTNPT